MVLIVEFRVTMPMTVAEYEIGQRHCTAREMRKAADSVKVLVDEPFTVSSGVQPPESSLSSILDKGQYTHTVFSMASKLPYYMQPFLKLPGVSQYLHEKCWDAFPYCSTVFTLDKLNGEKCYVRIESVSLPDRGTTHNALGLDAKTLEKREVVVVDITNDAIDEYKESEDPSKFQSLKTGRGPLSKMNGKKQEARWQDKVHPVMTCYKLVTIHIKHSLLQFTEPKIKYFQQATITTFHRQIFCSIDQWFEGEEKSEEKAIKNGR